MKRKILITPKSFIQVRDIADTMLDSEHYEVLFNETGKTYTHAEMVKLCKDIDGLLVGIDPVTSDVIEEASRLQVISKYGAGLDNIDIPAATSKGIVIKKAVGGNSTSVAELAIGFLYMLSKHLSEEVQLCKKGEWQRKVGTELRRKTLGLIGLGSIGKEVARMANGIGMQVIATDPCPQDNNFLKKYSIVLTSFDEVLSKSDFVSLHLPLNKDTSGIIGANSLGKMKPTAYLINTARGGLIDETALFSALSNGIIAGAAQDVFSQEPPPISHPLLKLNNFYLTPHMGAYTTEAIRSTALSAVENLLVVLESKEGV